MWACQGYEREPQHKLVRAQLMDRGETVSSGERELFLGHVHEGQ